MSAVTTTRADGLYVGLISGTSMDGVDAVLVNLEPDGMRQIAALTHPYPRELSAALHCAISPTARLSLDEFARLHIQVGECFADAVAKLLTSAQISRERIVAIGSHGQTLYHAPRAKHPYTLQIGSAPTITARTGIITVADFRSLDVAYGGEGAPLVPGFHAWLLQHPSENRVILNIGGIANLSLLPAGPGLPRRGYDTGPGNCLMDAWCTRHRAAPFDVDGAWAASGTAHPALLKRLLADPYFHAPAPKSTGREAFNLAYLDLILGEPAFHGVPPVDVQATLAALTVETIAREIEFTGENWAGGVFVCGGGARNTRVMEMLAVRIAPMPVETTARLGLDPDMVEASAFAWLAWRRMEHLPVNLTTGPQSRALVLGCVYEPTAGYAAI